MLIKERLKGGIGGAAEGLRKGLHILDPCSQIEVVGKRSFNSINEVIASLEKVGISVSESELRAALQRTNAAEMSLGLGPDNHPYSLQMTQSGEKYVAVGIRYPVRIEEQKEGAPRLANPTAFAGWENLLGKQ